MRIAAIALALAASLLLASGCSGPASVKEARAKVDVFHQRLDQGAYDAVWRDSAEEITRTESKAALVGLLSGIHARFGRVKQTSQSGWKVNYENGVSTAEVTMQTTFEKGALEEHFVFRGTEAGLKLAFYEFHEK
jgi:hypothetical protein